jgi:hypothetical protein
LVARCLVGCLRWLVSGCLTVGLRRGLVARSLVGCLRWLVSGCLTVGLRRALVARFLEKRETHPQENDHGTRKGEWQMEAKKATTPVAAGAAKRLIRRSGGWLHTQCSCAISP